MEPFSALETVLTGGAAKMLHQHSAAVLAKFGGIEPEIKALVTTIKKNDLSSVLRRAKKKLDPLAERFDPTGKAGLEDFLCLTLSTK